MCARDKTDRAPHHMPLVTPLLPAAGEGDSGAGEVQVVAWVEALPQVPGVPP